MTRQLAKTSFLEKGRDMNDKEYKLFKECHSHCPRYVQQKQSNFRCKCYRVMHDDVDSSFCFKFCDIKSDHTCGQCVNWVGHASSHGRHDKFGSCFYQIGNIGAWWPTCCPHFEYRKNDENYIDWIEQQVYNEYKRNDSSQECREARIRARKKWQEMHS